MCVDLIGNPLKLGDTVFIAKGVHIKTATIVWIDTIPWSDDSYEIMTVTAIDGGQGTIEPWDSNEVLKYEIM
jgi:acetyltransferase-like isoleucine patch superfamily enzyme